MNRLYCAVQHRSRTDICAFIVPTYGIDTVYMSAKVSSSCCTWEELKNFLFLVGTKEYNEAKMLPSQRNPCLRLWALVFLRMEDGPRALPSGIASTVPCVPQISSRRALKISINSCLFHPLDQINHIPSCFRTHA